MTRRDKETQTELLDLKSLALLACSLSPTVRSPAVRDRVPRSVTVREAIALMNSTRIRVGPGINVSVAINAQDIREDTHRRTPRGYLLSGGGTRRNIC